MGRDTYSDYRIVNVALGAWLFVSALFTGIDASAAAIWNAIIVGFLLVMLAAWMIGMDHEILPRPKRAKDDLRGDMPEMAVPDEHQHMPYITPGGVTNPGVVSPDFHVQPGETTKG